MKTCKNLLLLICLFSLISCTKNDNEVQNKHDVETYIGLLKSSQYDSLYLPQFTYMDIPELLQYRNETQIITNFPVNPISSLYVPECKLGTYVLWTIESIRACSVNSQYLILRFPSQNPILELRHSDVSYLITDDVSHSIAAKAYYDWWENNRDKNFNEFKDVDPLAGTDFEWH